MEFIQSLKNISTNIIAITGSCGKTTLKELLGNSLKKISKVRGVRYVIPTIPEDCTDWSDCYPSKKRLSKYNTASTFACIILFPSSSLIAGPDDPKGKMPFG